MALVGRETEGKFSLNGCLVDIKGFPALSLNEYIRERTNLKGTKIACGEGGCGACSVIATTFDPQTNETSSTSLNSCLAPLGALDGVAITTVEALGCSSHGFSSVQEAFAQHHASQCGYCTPGFIVACHATLAKAGQNGQQPSAGDFMQGLDGNLCRCTGYQPIMDACQTLVEMEDLCSAKSLPNSGLPAFPQALKQHVLSSLQAKKTASAHEGETETGAPAWLSPSDMPSLQQCLKQAQGTDFQLLAGNTASGVYHEWPGAKTIINIKGVRELHTIHRDQAGLHVGAAVPFGKMIDELTQNPTEKAYHAMAAHIQRIAGAHVRSAATPGGNLALLVNPKYYLESDFATVLMGAGGSVCLAQGHESRWLSMQQFLAETAGKGLDADQLVTGVRFPPCSTEYTFWSKKVANRFYNSHALVNLALSYTKTDDGALKDVHIAVGCPTLFREGATCEAKVAWQLRLAEKTAWMLEGGILNVQTVIACLHALQKEICPATNQDGPASFYRSTAEGLLFQALAVLLPADVKQSMGALLHAAPLDPPSVPKGRQSYPSAPKQQHPVGLPIEKDRIRLQASGEACYTSDLGTSNHLYAAVVTSTQALATIDHLEASAALQLKGVHAFVSAADIPGENKVALGGGDAEIFASERTEYVHQPLGLIVADSPSLARQAAALVKVAYSAPQDGKKPILDLEAGIAAETYSKIPDGNGGSRSLGDATEALKNAPHTILNAQYTLPSQQHFYMETQSAVAEPQEGGTFLVHSSTQSLDGVQASVARALGRPAHDVTVVCRRAGGGFGGKVTRSFPLAAAAAIAARKVKRPVFYQLNRNEDFRINGGRSETKIEYDVGFDSNGRISALKVRGWFLAGAELDLGWNDLMILRDGADQVYGIPNIEIDLKLVRTNLPPRTIVRGPGFLNAAMVMEEVLQQVAEFLGKDSVKIRQLNFMSAPESTSTVPSSQSLSASLVGRLTQLLKPRTAVTCHQSTRRSADSPPTSLSRPIQAKCWTLPRIWEGLLEMSDFNARRQAIQDFNKGSVWRKKGISINPCRFDSAPQASSAVVCIYYDGTILVSHGGLEVGQGLSTKVKQTTIYELSKLLPESLRPLPLSLVRINDSRTDITPAAGPTWSSTGSESSCAAVTDACKQLLKSLQPAAESVKDAHTPQDFWKAVLEKVFDPAQVGFAPATVPLTASGFFDGSETGGKEPMNYTAFGAAVSEVEVDVLTGDRRILRCDIHFDCGTSLNPMIDMGQVEGAFVQGLGLMTSEQVMVDPDSGRLITDSTWNYKIPSVADIPQQLYVSFLKDSPNPRGVMGSKASGEPSLLLSTSILYALRHAVQAARENLQTLQQSSCSPTEAVDSKEKSNGPGNSQKQIFSFDAPATVVKQKQACGSFSVASILQAHLDDTARESRQECSTVQRVGMGKADRDQSDSDSSWVVAY